MRSCLISDHLCSEVNAAEGVAATAISSSAEVIRMRQYIHISKPLGATCVASLGYQIQIDSIFNVLLLSDFLCALTLDAPRALVSVLECCEHLMNLRKWAWSCAINILADPANRRLPSEWKCSTVRCEPMSSVRLPNKVQMSFANTRTNPWRLSGWSVDKRRGYRSTCWRKATW